MHNLLQTIRKHPIVTILIFLTCMGVSIYSHKIPATPLSETIGTISLIATLLVAIPSMMVILDDINDID